MVYVFFPAANGHLPHHIMGNPIQHCHCQGIPLARCRARVQRLSHKHLGEEVKTVICWGSTRGNVGIKQRSRRSNGFETDLTTVYFSDRFIIRNISFGALLT